SALLTNHRAHTNTPILHHAGTISPHQLSQERYQTMIQIYQTKKVQSVWPQARINNAAVTCASVDRRGFDYAVVRVAIGATDIGFTTFKLQESDDNSTFTDISGADLSVAPLVIPATAQPTPQ